MGIDYSYQVYVHQRNAGRFLAEVAGLCDSTEGGWTTVVLVDGGSVALPGTCDFKAGRTVEWAEVVGDDPPRFDLSPFFPEDDPLREYGATHGTTVRTWRDGTTRFAVAYTYLVVFDGSSLLPAHCVFDFTPATSSQSRLFLSSPSIRTTFSALAQSVAAPLCLLDVEESHKIVVTANNHHVSTRVPGSCVLWDSGAPENQAYEELQARLAGPSPTATSRWISGPEHTGYKTFVDTLAGNSGVPGAVR